MYNAEVNTDGYIQQFKGFLSLNDLTICLNKHFNYSQEGAIHYEDKVVRTVGHEKYAAANKIIITIENTEQGVGVGQS